MSGLQRCRVLFGTHSRIVPQFSQPIPHHDSNTARNADAMPDTGMLMTEYRQREVVPSDCPLASDFQVSMLADFIDSAKGKVLVLTGAGISTESGIPDYRTTQLKYKPVNPLTHQQFVSQPHSQRRYWARGLFGYERLSKCPPNRTHTTLAKLQQAHIVDSQITQNVDGLLTRAGCTNVLELHGSIHGVMCLGCSWRCTRSELQTRLLELNKSWMLDVTNQVAAVKGVQPATLPDGDFELTKEQIDDFQYPSCERCKKDLMPTLVFFGGRVDSHVADQSHQWVDMATHMLVLGSTCATWSSYRLVSQAKAQHKPIAVATFGQTRADQDLTLPKIEARLGDLLERVGYELGVGRV